jgi:hypothetical protein
MVGRLQALVQRLAAPAQIMKFKHKASNTIELTLNFPSYVCVQSTAEDLAYTVGRAHALPA